MKAFTRSHLRPQQAQAIQQWFGPRVSIAPWDERDHRARRSKTVGECDQACRNSPNLFSTISRLPADAAVADLVYVPLVTPLLRAAMARNLRTADGLGMLLRQAVPQFHLWFGKRPEITGELRSLLEQNLAVPQPRSQE
jgi:shikimate dehydrogenase